MLGCKFSIETNTQGYKIRTTVTVENSFVTLTPDQVSEVDPALHSDEVFAQAHPGALSEWDEGSCDDLALVLGRKPVGVKLFWLGEKFWVHVES
jgi:hypothetical protein